MPRRKSKSKARKSTTRKSYNKPKLSAMRKSHSNKPRTKTRMIISHKTKPRIHVMTASSNMSITDLQFMAKSRGIPFGGLNKTQLINKINNV